MIGSWTTDRWARRRFEAELISFRAEFKTAASEVESDTTPEWVRRGRSLLGRASIALDEGDIERGWAYLHAAKRLKLQSTDTNAIEGEANELVEEAKGSGLGWRARAVQRRLTTDDGSIRNTIEIPDLQSATELLHKGYEDVHLKRRHLQTQINYLAIGGLAVVLLMIIVSIFSIGVAGLPSPFADVTAAAAGDAVDGGGAGNVTATPTATPSPTSTPQSGPTGNATANATPSPTPTGSPPATSTPSQNETASGPPGDDSGSSQRAPAGFLLYIVLFGMLGAVLFGIRSIKNRSTSTTTPQYLSGRQAALIRMIVGAISALAVFFFVLSGFLDISVGVDDSSGPLYITLAFVAGYSERLVHDTVEFVSSTAVPETSENGGA
ncbi:hypothetical protein DU484_01945 [Haloplanus rubicundus]|uniref:Uncharacterized protein n=2 Tax=Haloplanus rubicundus TaxID=1547898 RepID=A0A345E946_9EURY|nr:hypothetical protein DU484_01945 [Haloplanus rubicundus]